MCGFNEAVEYGIWEVTEMEWDGLCLDSVVLGVGLYMQCGKLFVGSVGN